ncbi:MAG TPA: ATP-binding cassette domain-containing protein [Fimbriimonadaceae bacterium]|nr:ATP-binding cassette domain-containing protein [Fimbriimonadaceae bacterium]
MVRVESLSKSYGAKQVLKDINLEVAPGEIVAIMGTSGGGKTTLLRCITGLTPPTAGKVTVAGIDVQQQPEEARRHMGLVFQSAALFDYLNVRDNVLFGVRRRMKISSKDAQQLASETLARVGLEGTERLMPSELSGGMRKRVGIARALALSPEVMLYDEPTTGLDPITAYTIDSLIVRLNRASSVTTIIVSHDVSSVFRTAGRIAFLEAGQLSFLGSPEEFRRTKRAAIAELVAKSSAESLEEID